MAPLSLLLLLISVILAYGLKSTKQPYVCSVAGCMRGTLMPGYQSDEFEAFMGIPYAMPPVGKLRFSNPKAYPKWLGKLNATQPKNDCIQKNYLLPTPAISGAEDCLYLNVYRPKFSYKEKPRLLPVMVYIHGGGWFSGTSSPLIHGPEYFMDTKEVLLVTFAYRLGPFGFLSTNDVNMPGNFGLKDQNLALRWVQKNIFFFGGDAKRVTIFGQSAGGVSVHMHMLSKQSEGLFHKVIALSGTANVPFAMTERPLKQTRDLATFCNISDANTLSTVKLAQALRGIEADSILNAADGFKYWHVDNMVNFRAVVEKRGDHDSFLVDHPKRLLAEGKFKPVPLLLGSVPQEGAVRVISILENTTLRTEFNARFDELLEKLLEFPEYFNATQKQAKTQTVIDEYFKGEHELNVATAQGFLETITDRGFHNPLYNVVYNYVHTINTDKHPLNLYVFDYKGPYSFASLYTDATNARNYGVVHCDDLIYLFRSPLLFPDFAKNSTDATVIKHFVGYFVEYAKSSSTLLLDGKPCSKHNFNSSSNAICDYQTFVNSEPNSLAIKTENHFNVRRMRFWNALLES